MQKQTRLNYKPWIMLSWLFSVQLLAAFVARSIAPLGPLIGDSFELTMAQIGMFPAALFLGQSLISIPSGILTDKIGSRNMIFILTLVLSGSFLIMSFTTSFLFLLLLLVLAGFAYGSSHPTTNRGIVYWFPLKKRGTAMGIKQMGVTLGSALAAFTLLPIANTFGWEYAVIFASISLFVIGVTVYFLYDDPKETLGENLSPKNSSENGFQQALQLLKHKALLLVTVSAMLLSGSQMILNTFLVLYTYERLGVSIILAGILLGIAEIGGSIGRVCWGIVSDNVFKGKRTIVLLIISLLVAGTSIIFALLPHGTNFYLIATVIFIFGFTASGFNGVWMNATTEIVAPSLSGVATGISLTFGSWGVILFPPIFGAIVDYTESYTIGWVFVAILMVISTVSLLFAMRFKSSPKKSIKKL